MATSEKTEVGSNETAMTMLETKLIQLGGARHKADAVLRAGKERAIGRHIERPSRCNFYHPQMAFKRFKVGTNKQSMNRIGGTDQCHKLSR